MKVLCFTKSLPVYGGVERWLGDLAGGLQRGGTHCAVGLAKGLCFHQPAAYLAAYPELTSPIELDGLSGAASSRRLAAAKAIASVRPDVVVPVMCADGLAEAVRLKGRFGFRIVYPVHEICEGVSNDLRRFGPWLDDVVFVDQGGLQRYQSLLDAGAGRVRLIACGVPSATAARLDQGQDVLRIGFCGRLQHTQKRVLDLVELCGHLERMGQAYQLQLVGDGPERLVLTERFAELIDRGVVKMLPPTARDELFKSFYPAIDVLLVTSDWETGPLVAFEAMMNHCLVVTSDFSGREVSRSLIDGENCLVFPVGNMEAAARRLQWVAAHRNDARTIAHRGFRYAMEKRSLDQMVASWVGVFRSAKAAAPALGTAPAPKDKAGQSRLEALGCPDWLSTKLRLWSGRRFKHAHAGEEWPYYSGSVHE